MRGLRTAACLALMAAAAPVAAQDRMTQALCTDSWTAVMALLEAEAPVPDLEVDDDGWCALTGESFDLDDFTSVRADAVRWRGTDFARFIDEGLPPRALEFDLVNAQVVPHSGDPIMDYLMGVQMGEAGVDFAAGLRWDGVQNAVFLEDLVLRFSEDNFIEANVRVDGADLTDLASIQTSVGTAGLRDLSAKVAFDGWFEAYAVFALGYAVLDPDGPAPQAQVAALKETTIGALESLPADAVPETSRAALAAFITSLPTPRGVAQVQLSAEPTLGMTRLAPVMLSGAAPSFEEVATRLLDGTSLLFTWSPSGG